MWVSRSPAQWAPVQYDLGRLERRPCVGDGPGLLGQVTEPVIVVPLEDGEAIVERPGSGLAPGLVPRAVVLLAEQALQAGTRCERSGLETCASKWSAAYSFVSALPPRRPTETARRVEAGVVTRGHSNGACGVAPSVEPSATV